MKRALVVALAATALVAIPSGVSLATISNGGFETGDFTGWNQTGNNNGDLASYSVITNLGSVTPTEGTHMAMVEGTSVTDFNFLWSDAFDWASYTEVCFDIRVLFNGSPDFDEVLFQAAANAPPAGQPILARETIESETTYQTINFITNQTVTDIPLLSGGDTGFDSMTEWETFCFDPSQIAFDSGNANTPLSFFLRFGWSNDSFTDQAFLIDNVVGTGPAAIDIDETASGYAIQRTGSCTTQGDLVADFVQFDVPGTFSMEANSSVDMKVTFDQGLEVRPGAVSSLLIADLNPVGQNLGGGTEFAGPQMELTGANVQTSFAARGFVQTTGGVSGANAEQFFAGDSLLVDSTMAGRIDSFRAVFDVPASALPTTVEATFFIQAIAECPAAGDPDPLLAIPASEPTDALIDIQPRDRRNRVNLSSKFLEVAILSTADFDATTVDPATVAFGPGEASPEQFKIVDIDRDGDLDLHLLIPTADTGLVSSDTEACLTAATFDGAEVEGCDDVDIREPRRRRRR